MARRQPETVSIPAAATRLNISLSAAYRAVRAGHFPVPIIRVGGRVLVSKAALDALLAAPAGREPRDAA